MSVHSLPSLMKGDKRESRPDAEPRWRTLLMQERRDLCCLSLWRGAFAEFVGTGLLCLFTIGFGLTPEDGRSPPILQVAIACGFFIGVIITAFANVSGGHVNPCISLAFCLTGHCTICRFIIYAVFQVMGAVAGTGFLKFISPSGHVGALGLIQPHVDASDSQAIAAEAVITFLLIFVTVAMIDPRRKDVQGSVPLMVGLTVAVNICFANTTSGACMNPARAIGPAVVTGDWNKLWIYWLGPVSGAAVGAVLYDVFFSAGRLRSKRWCSPRKFHDLGKDTAADDSDDENNNDGDDCVTSESIPLRNGGANRLDCSTDGP